MADINKTSTGRSILTVQSNMPVQSNALPRWIVTISTRAKNMQPVKIEIQAATAKAARRATEIFFLSARITDVEAKNA